MSFFEIIFKSLKPSYLIRQYIFGAIIYIFMLYTGFASQNLMNGLFLTLCLVLYPFAMFVYDSIIGLLMGDNVFITNIIFSIVWAICKVIVIFTLSIIIAPFGVGYLYFTGKKS